MSDSLASFATTGKFNFKSLVASILTDLAKMEVRIAASKILTSIISAWGGSYGTAAGNVASAGVNSSGQAVAVNPWANANGGVYASSSLSHYSG
jgi:lambda family phage tail tape measure protein